MWELPSSVILLPIASAIETSLNVNSGTRKSIRSESCTRAQERYKFLDVETLRWKVQPVWREEISAYAEYELAICYGAAFLWHFNLLILLAGRHPSAPAFRNHGASASLLASYYRNCLARTLLPRNFNNLQPRKRALLPQFTINLQTRYRDTFLNSHFDKWFLYL